MVPSRWVGARLQDADHKYTDGAVRASLNRLHAGVSGEAHQRERLCRYIARAAVAAPPLAGRGCLLHPSAAADERSSGDLGVRRIL